jgi:hypothetical protein
VSNTSNEGLEIGSGADGSLHESVDSSQMAINLAAASKTIQFDLFLTFTCNQSKHPGIRHLFDWKKSEGWTKQFPDWKYLSAAEREEVSKSFEMAYMSIVSRSWMEVRKLLLQFLIKSSSTILGKVLPAFFRDEYQEESGNLSHIHGLLGLFRRDMDVKEFRDFVCSLQRSAICDLITGDEVKGYIEEGLLKDVQDFKDYTDLADQILVHSCSSGRCLIRQGDSGTPDDYKCKKPHPVKAPFAAALANGQDGQNTSDSSNSSVVSPRIEARRYLSKYRKNSVQPLKTPEDERPPPSIFLPSLQDRERCPDLLPRHSTPKTKRSKLQPETSSEDDDSDSNNSYQADSFLDMSNESSSSGSFKTDDCEESESESIDELEEDSEPFEDDYKEEDYDSSDEDDDDDETPFVPPKRSSRKRKITPTKRFEYAKRKKVSTKKQKTIQDCAPYACTTEKDAIAFLPTNAGNSANKTDDSDANGSSI